MKDEKLDMDEDDRERYKKRITPALSDLVTSIEQEMNHRTATWLGERAARLRREARELPAEQFAKHLQAKALEQAAFDLLGGEEP